MGEITNSINKGAKRGEYDWSLSILDGRITLYRYKASDYTMISFPGTMEDISRFDEECPEDWFDVAATIIAERT